MSGKGQTARAADPAQPDEINFGWLVRLRWSMAAGQLLTILGVRYLLGLPLPLQPLLVIVGIEAASNLAASVLGRRRPARQGWMAALMALDVVLCTGLLFFTGGPSNPFSFLYLVQIALAATTLRGTLTWALTALALAGSAVLFGWHRPLPVTGSHEQYMNLHLQGMWVAFGVAAAFIVYFLLRVRRALAQREDELARSRLVAARQERLASLATLAAGAAHELSTPLGTIAVVMRELQRRASLIDAEPTVMEDLRLVREQVDRCRGILERMSTDAGETVGEGTTAMPVAELLAGVIGELPDIVPVNTTYANGEAALRLRVPRRALGQALSGLVKNAQEATAALSPAGPSRATPAAAAVSLHVWANGTGLTFEVRDHGAGMGAAVLERVGEPFFSTKATGRGMGLGVFLARTTVERLGGRLLLESSSRGTTARLELPARLIEPAGAAA